MEFKLSFSDASRDFSRNETNEQLMKTIVLLNHFIVAELSLRDFISFSFKLYLTRLTHNSFPTNKLVALT
jgi:hypothetical protein